MWTLSGEGFIGKPTVKRGDRNTDIKNLQLLVLIVRTKIKKAQVLAVLT